MKKRMTNRGKNLIAIVLTKLLDLLKQEKEGGNDGQAKRLSN